VKAKAPNILTASSGQAAAARFFAISPIAPTGKIVAAATPVSPCSASRRVYVSSFPIFVIASVPFMFTFPTENVLQDATVLNQ
jgi:hypothetical protein